MKQFFVPCAPDGYGRVILEGKDYHYLARVRRVREGGALNITLPSGEKAYARVRALTARRIELEIEAPLENPAAASRSAEAMPRIMLIQGMPKGAKMDLIVRQAVECGVNEIVPFAAEHSVRRPRDAEAQRERWLRIVREARQQSGSAVETSVHPPLDVEALFALWAKREAGVGILLQSGGRGTAALHHALGGGASFTALAVGPEGGFSRGEERRFIDAGFAPVSLGPPVLRTETAALAAIAAARILLLEKDSWEAIANVSNY